jgi:1-acyl-sn-glycerol-3-phosphate acyltransferase
MSDEPHYPLPWRIAPGLARDVWLGRQRSFAADCAAMVTRMAPPPEVSGLEHIPTAGPFALVANHYEGPGLWIGWAAALLTDAIGRVRPARAPVHWLVTGAMDRRRVRGAKKLVPGTAWLFGRVADAWEMVVIPPADAPTAARAGALRQAIRLIAPTSGAGVPVGVFPEGEGDGFAGLRTALPGSGSLIGRLARSGAPVLPAAVWAEQGRMHARFGPKWRPDMRDDGALRAEMMQRIAELLPERLRGRCEPSPLLAPQDCEPAPLPSSGEGRDT